MCVHMCMNACVCQHLSLNFVMELRGSHNNSNPNICLKNTKSVRKSYNFFHVTKQNVKLREKFWVVVYSKNFHPSNNEYNCDSSCNTHTLYKIVVSELQCMYYFVLQHMHV